LGGGDEENERWYPADTLQPLDWQIASDIKDPLFNGEVTKLMVKSAKRTPDVNYNVLKKGALKPLGILPSLQHYHVRFIPINQDQTLKTL